MNFLGFGFPAHIDSTMAYHRQFKYTRGEDDGGVPPSLSVRETLLDKQYSESYEAARTNLVSARGTRKKSYKILVVRITQNENR